MGTRSLTCAYLNGEYKVAQYGQWDGCPEGQGATILDFLRKLKIDKLKDCISECCFLSEKVLDALTTSNSTSIKLERIFPALSRDTGGEIFSQIMFNEQKVLYNNIDFAKNSLFCEWAYVVDFDSGKFEVYHGFNKEPLTENDRFYFDGFVSNGYYPVKKVTEFDLNNLPTEDEFLNHFKNDETE